MGNIHPLTIYPNSKTTVEAPANEFTVSNNLANQGRCPRCGIQTHNSEKYGIFFLSSHLVPLTNDHVINGRCTSCNPLSKCNVIEDADDEVLPPDATLKAVPHNDAGIIQVPPVSERGVCDLRLKGKKMLAGLTVLILVVIAVVLCAKFGVFKFHDDTNTTTNTTSKSETPTRATVTTEIAQYDGGLGAPKCSQVSSSCDSGPLLLAGKGPDEANFPGNTIDDCWEYGMGTYHEDSSIDSIVVSTIDMTDFKPGSTVQIDAKIWGIAEQDATSIHFFYTADATDPSWQFIETVDKISAGESTVSTQYILPNGSLQAVRVVCRDVGIANPCPQGGGDDIDDLVFAVG
jgi:hypothetical protein